MSSLYRRSLTWAQRSAPDRMELLRRMARALQAEQLVLPSFEAAVLAREASSPTGLPLSGRPVALPHANPEHVRAPAALCCTLSKPVSFCEMGNPTVELPVTLVVMLALPDALSSQREIVGLIERLQEPRFVEELATAPADEALYQLLVPGERR